MFVSTNSVGDLEFINNYGDLTDDGVVDVRDLVRLTQAIDGSKPVPPNLAARGDLTQDGKIDDKDRLILADMIARRSVGPSEDIDHDDLPNIEEFAWHTHPFHPDADGDGWYDGWEVADGKDPLDPRSQILMTILSRPPVRLNLVAPEPADEAVGAITIARPPVRLNLAAPEATNEAVGAITIARPPVTINNPAE